MQTTNEGKNVMVTGRIVWVSGDLFKGKPMTDQQTRQPIIDTKTGMQKINYGFGLAVPKSALNANPDNIWSVIHAAAQALYPNGHIPPAFSFKKKDGDTDIDESGKPYSQREGYPGCIVFACTTNLPIKYFRFENGQNFMINEGIKCGDYVDVQLNVKAHPPVGQGKPGLYLNPNAVRFLAYGKEIVNTPSGDQIFGTQAPAIPAGGSATPISPAGFIQPQQPMGAPQNAFPPSPQGFPQPAAVPATPNWNVLPPTLQQQPAPAPVGNGLPPPQMGFAPPATQGQFGMPPQPSAPVANAAYPSAPMVPGPAMPAAPQHGGMQPPMPAMNAQPQQWGPPPMPGQFR